MPVAHFVVGFELLPLCHSIENVPVQIDSPFYTLSNVFDLSSRFSKLLAILSILFILIFFLSHSTPTLAPIFTRSL